MTRIGLAAILAATSLAACAPPEITSRLDSTDALYSSFDGPEGYVPTPIGARADNDLMRFSTAALPDYGPQ